MSSASPTSATQTIAIAGAGIGGIAAALALSQRGLSSHIFERREQASESGAGIQLGPNATRVLDGLGVLKSVRAFASEPDALSIHDAVTGRVLSRFPLGSQMQHRFGAPYLTLHRQDLHRVLASAVLGDELIAFAPGREVVGFQNRADGVDVKFAAGVPVPAAALIAADGLWSRLRPLVADNAATPTPAGKLAYRTVVPRDALPKNLAANDVHIWLSPGAHVVHYPVRHGEDVAIVVVIDGSAAEDEWNSNASVADLAASPIARFAMPVRELILASNPWRMWPLQTIAPLQSWTKGCVALMGDAAHPMLPFFAQGGGLAIEDAAVLAQFLTRSGAMPERLQGYEAARRARANRVVAAAQNNGQIYHLSGAAAMARNAVLAAVPPSVMMRRYDWLYGWTA